MNFTTISNAKQERHQYLDFVNIDIEKDNPLFIDPLRIQLAASAGDVWAIAANKLIKSYFAEICTAAKAKDREKLYGLLEHSGEMNETRLGFSLNKPAGRGASVEIIFPAIIDMMRKGYFEDNLVTGITDIPIWCHNIAEDRLSDWITNIIWPVLQDFTREQFLKFKVPYDTNDVVLTPQWDMNARHWMQGTQQRFIIGGQSILLVPKHFVHTKLLLSAETFLKKEVLQQRQIDHLHQHSALCTRKQRKNGESFWVPPTKKDLMRYEVKGLDHREYFEPIATEHPELIRNYHRRLEWRPEINECFITDSQLDALLYFYQ